MKDKKYKEAKEGYIAAKAAFEKAAAGVEAGKKAAAEQVGAAMTALEEAWKNLEAMAKKVEKNMKDKKDAGRPMPKRSAKAWQRPKRWRLLIRLAPRQSWMS